MMGKITLGGRRVSGRAVAGLVVGLLLVLNLTGQLERLIGALGKTRLDDSNRAYLQLTLERATKGFLVLTVFKTGLAVIEGSRVGVSVGVAGDIEIGDVVEPILDVVNLAWKTMLLSMIVLFALQILLAAAAHLSPAVLSISLVCVGAHVGACGLPTRWRRVRTVTATLTAFSVVLAVTLYALLPLSVFGASKLSQRFTAPSADAATTEITTLRGEVLPPESAFTAAGLADRIKGLGEKLREMGENLRIWARDLSRSIIKLVTAYIFDCVVFPLGYLLCLFWLTRGVVARLLEATERRVAQADMAVAFRQALDDWQAAHAGPPGGAVLPRPDVPGETAPPVSRGAESK